MLCAFFDVQPVSKPGAEGGSGGGPKFKVRGRSKKEKPATATEVRPSESATTVLHTQFEALPKERNVPKAYEADELYELSDDEAAVAAEEQWDYVREDADKEEIFEEDEAESEMGDTESLASKDDCGSELSQSFDESSVLRKRSKPAASGAAGGKTMYSGPQLCLENDDFLD
jgi:hypothetical protein